MVLEGESLLAELFAIIRDLLQLALWCLRVKVFTNYSIVYAVCTQLYIYYCNESTYTNRKRLRLRIK